MAWPARCPAASRHRPELPMNSPGPPIPPGPHRVRRAALVADVLVVLETGRPAHVPTIVRGPRRAPEPNLADFTADPTAWAGPIPTRVCRLQCGGGFPPGGPACTA